MAEHKTISFEEAKHIIDTEKDCVVLDVREESEYLTGHIEDALNFPVDTISNQEASEMISDKNTTLLVYCKTGKRSGMAYKRLKELGYKNIYDIGCLIGWPYGLDY